MKKQSLLATVIAVLIFTHVTAQKSKSFNSSTYTSALGIKLYPGTGGAAVTFKHFLKESAAVEALGSVWDRGTRVTGLYEFHWDIKDVAGLKWYVGPGAHFGLYKNSRYITNNGIREDGSYAAFGVDGVIGADYKFNKIPLNLSADWQPSFEFGGNRYNGFGGDFGGISARYTF
ncbi:MAG: hypothetical protein ABIQ31_12160 [Ferruginibacter sp.]